jgi:hypothetical protein
MEDEENVILYIVELCYGNQKFYVADKNNNRHLQIRTDIPLWHKENMINIGVEKLLPKNWKAFAWIDADVEFENNSWAMDTLKILNGSKDIVQIYSHCVDMDENGSSMSIFNSFGYQLTKGYRYSNKGINFWHPGYAWAITRKAYDKIGRLYDLSILGSGDHNMSFGLINCALKSINNLVSENYKLSVLEFQKKANRLRFGYVPGVIRHYYHGTKKNRQYNERWQILVKHQYDPIEHVIYDIDGILIPTYKFPESLKTDIFAYFMARNEDDI